MGYLVSEEMIKTYLEGTKDAGIAQTNMVGQATKIATEDIQMPEYLDGTVEKTVVVAMMVK